MDVLSTVQDQFSLVDIFGQFKQSQHVNPWKVVVATIVWTLWLARNDCVFGGKRIEQNSLVSLINIRSFKWLEASSLVCHNFFKFKYWNVVPRVVDSISSFHFNKLFWRKFLKDQCHLRSRWLF